MGAWPKGSCEQPAGNGEPWQVLGREVAMTRFRQITVAAMRTDRREGG